MLLFINGDVPTVFEAATSEDERDVGGAVSAGIAEIGTKDDSGGVEQRTSVLLRLFELGEEVGERGELSFLDDFEFSDLGGVLAVMGKIVPSYCCKKLGR